MSTPSRQMILDTKLKFDLNEYAKLRDALDVHTPFTIIAIVAGAEEGVPFFFAECCGDFLQSITDWFPQSDSCEIYTYAENVYKIDYFHGGTCTYLFRGVREDADIYELLHKVNVQTRPLTKEDLDAYTMPIAYFVSSALRIQGK